MKTTVITAAFIISSGYAHAQNDTIKQTLDNIVVTGTRNKTDIRHLPMTVSITDRQTLTENQRTNILPTLAEQVPGLFVTGRGMAGYGVSNGAAGSINLRGISGSSGQLMVLIDGHPQYQGLYGHPISDSYQTMMAQQVEVLRGPASVLYGSNAMGGVINIVTRNMQHNGIKTDINLGAGSYGTFQAEAGSRMRSGKFSGVAAAQYSRTDNHRPNMGFEQYGGYLKTGYDISSNWNVYADADITHFNSSYPGTVQTPMLDADQWITRGMISAAIENHYAHTSGALSVYSNFGRHKINDGHTIAAEPQSRLFRSKDALTGLSLYQSLTLFQGNRITAGFDYQNIYGRAYYTSIATGEILETQNKQSGHKHINEIAGYADFRQDIARWLTIDAGIRIDHHSVSGTEWIPQGGIVLRPTVTGELKLMAANGFRNPTLREMYLYPPSNEELEPERIMSYELSWKQRLVNDAISYGINLFYINGDNMIQTVNRKNINTGSIENCGIELEWAYRISNHWYVNNNYSLLHTHKHIVGAPRFKGYAGARYTCGKWHVASGLQYINGLYTDETDSGIQENFLLLNATVTYNINRHLSLWTKGENILAQKYETMLGYPMPRATFMCGMQLKI